MFATEPLLKREKSCQPWQEMCFIHIYSHMQTLHTFRLFTLSWFRYHPKISNRTQKGPVLSAKKPLERTFFLIRILSRHVYTFQERIMWLDSKNCHRGSKKEKACGGTMGHIWLYLWQVECAGWWGGCTRKAASSMDGTCFLRHMLCTYRLSSVLLPSDRWSKMGYQNQVLHVYCR